MNGKQARAARRAARQAQAVEILLASAAKKPGVYLVVVDDARDEDVVRIIDYSNVDAASGRGGRVLFDDTGAAN